MSRSSSRSAGGRPQPGRLPQQRRGSSPGRAVPLLAATLIVKDEAENLPIVLASLASLVDEVVVYDTGSDDHTVAIARAHGATVIEGYWDDDFARARNASLEATDAEWILWVDGDDQLSGRMSGDAGALRAYLAGDASALPGAPPPGSVDLVQLRVINVSVADTEMHTLDSIRIARRDRVRWTGAIHERLEIVDGGRRGKAISLEPSLLHVRHRGYADPAMVAAKGERNVAIAQAQLDTLVAAVSTDGEPAARAAFDLGRSLLLLHRFQEAVDAFEIVREIAPDGLYRAQATVMLAQTLLDAGGFDQVVLYLADQLRAEGETSEAFCDWLRAQAMARLGDRRGALDLLRGITELIEPVGNRASLEPVLLARSLYAGAEGLLPESAQSMLDAVLRYGPRDDRCALLIKLWAGRLDELTEAIRADHGPFRDEALAAVRAAGVNLPARHDTERTSPLSH